MSAEADLLAARGHDVLRYECTNADTLERGGVATIRALWHIDWGRQSRAEIGAVMDEFRPDVLHVHNYMFTLTPSIFSAAKERGIATVMTLHNYRLLCPSGQFLRSGKPCESCLHGGGPWRPLLYRCYPGGSLIKTIAAVRLYRKTQRRRLLSDYVDAYIALTKFAAQKHIEGGLPASQVHVKANFQPDPFVSSSPSPAGQGALYVGRLSPEKGVARLLRAWRGINYPLTIVGDGPLLGSLRAIAPPSVTFTGHLGKQDIFRYIQASAFLVFPSIWYEGFPLVLLEAMACGRPVIANDLGGRAEIVTPETGLLCESANPESLAAAARTLISDPVRCARLGQNARRLFLELFTPERNYERLMAIYSAALAHSRSSALEPVPVN